MSDTLAQAARPSLLRRLAALFYDAWLILALWLLGATVDWTLRTALGGQAGEGSHWLLQAYLLATPVVFHVWFWTHGGQTLGMRTWRIRLVSGDGGPVTMRQGLLRCAAALLSWLPLGLGYLWALFDRDRAAWHDRLSGTFPVLTERSAANI